MKSSPSPIQTLLSTVAKLRDPDHGCPWDLKQTHQSLRSYLIEEAYEVLDVLDQLDSDGLSFDPKLEDNLRKELGDLLLQILLHSQLAKERGAFSFDDVAASLNEKLIRRHPHVFGAGAGKKISTAEISKNWEQIKAQEREADVRASVAGEYHKENDQSILAGIPRSLPALQKAEMVIDKVTKVGFQWDDLEGPIAKLQEELEEFLTELRAYQSKPTPEGKTGMEMELGDFLFCVANIAKLIGIQPEDALRANLRKFEKRFRYLEKKLLEKGKSLLEANLEEMNYYWEEAKQND